MKPIYIQSPSCPHFKACSGCSTDLGKEPLIWLEVLENFKSQVVPSLHQGSPTRWRCRAKLAVRGSSDNPIIGLFKKHTHDAISIPLCLVHHIKINQVIHYIEQWMKHHALMPYQEKDNSGDLRYLQCVVERSTGKVQVVFVLNIADASPQAQRWFSLLLELAQAFDPSLFHSIWINFNCRATNTIFSNRWQLVWGEEYVWERFGEVSVCFQPANFAQANLSLFEELLQKIKEWVPDGAKVAEFFAGVGVIGLFIASKCTWVKCGEVNPHAKLCFTLSRAKLPADAADKISFYTGSDEETLGLMQAADVVIVDPPRKGLSEAFIGSLKHSSVNQLIYVSCGWESFKKNCQQLALDGWKLEDLDGYAFFPGSNHIELLARFIR